MAKVQVVTILKGKKLAPGKSATWKWNNAPYGNVFALEVVPIPYIDNDFNHTSIARITKQWRKFIMKETKKGFTKELEIYYTVKNEGKETLFYKVKMARIY